MTLAPGWTRESAESFLHECGARITKTTYRGKMAWWFFPVSLDVQAVEYPPTEEGCQQAFELSGKNLPKVRSAPKKAAKRKVPTPDDSDATETEDEEGS